MSAAPHTLEVVMRLGELAVQQRSDVFRLAADDLASEGPPLDIEIGFEVGALRMLARGLAARNAPALTLRERSGRLHLERRAAVALTRDASASLLAALRVPLGVLAFVMVAAVVARAVALRG